jgi:hypothetical protein
VLDEPPHVVAGFAVLFEIEQLGFSEFVPGRIDAWILFSAGLHADEPVRRRPPTVTVPTLRGETLKVG